MSTYLTILATPAAEEKLLQWLAPHMPLEDAWPTQQDSPEHAVADLPGHGARLHHVARQARKDLLVRGETAAFAEGALFRGVGQSPDGSVLMFGAGGVGEAARNGVRGPLTSTAGEEWPGTHVAMQWDRERVRVHADFFRMLPLLYTQGPGFVGFSDSWQLLVRLRRAMGADVTVSAGTAIAMSVSRAITEHPMDTVTACAQVRLASVGAAVVAPLAGNGLGPVSVEQAGYPEIFAAPDEQWSQTVRRGAVSMVGTLRGLAGSGVDLRLSMSGGADSRAVMAAALRADPEQHMTTFTTAERSSGNAKDYDTVVALAESTGLHLGDKPSGRKPDRIRYPSPLASWMIASLGLHDRINTYLTRQGPAGSAILTGHGAGTYKATYGWRPFTRVTKGLAQFDPAAGAVAGYLGEEFLRGVGVDPTGPESSEWHYIGIRNSLHSGRYTLTSLLGFPPLMQRELTALAHVPVGAPQALPEELRRDAESNSPKLNTSLTAVLLTLLRPDLAVVPFDDERKDIDLQTRQTILDLAGGPLGDDEIPSTRVYGTPQDVVSGTAETFLSMADYWGQAAELDQRGLAPMIDKASRIIADLGLEPWYRNVVTIARDNLRDLDTDVKFQKDYGRILQFLPLDGADVDVRVPEHGPGALQELKGRRRFRRPRS
jgi:hypothetical protein